MQDVILIGDSIRMGYQDAVRRRLDGLARVWGPEQNGGNSANVLANLEAWALSRPADLVHVNCGLHDLKREFGAAVHAVEPEAYEANVSAILRRLQEAPGRRVVWASTTPVNQEWHHRNKGFDRFGADVDEYNRRAGAVVSRLGVPVDDLYGVIAAAGPDSLLKPDGVHFGEAGCELLGATVAQCIRLLLHDSSVEGG